MIALSIDGESLRMLHFAGKEVIRWENIPLPSHHVRGGFVSDPEAVGQLIRRVLAEGGLAKEKALFAFPSVGSACSILTLPSKLKSSQLREVIPREARRAMSFSMADSELYWQLLPKAKFEEQKVWVLSVPKEPLLKLVKACHLAELKLQAIELSALALNRAVGQGNAFIVHCELDRIGTIILADRVPVLIRSTLLEKESVEAEELRLQLLRHLSHTISYYNNTHRDAPLSSAIPIFVTGSLALDIAEKISSITELPVAEFKPPLPCPPDFPLSLYAVNLGLMLKKAR